MKDDIIVEHRVFGVRCDAMLVDLRGCEKQAPELTDPKVAALRSRSGDASPRGSKRHFVPSARCGDVNAAVLAAERLSSVHDEIDFTCRYSPRSGRVEGRANTRAPRADHHAHETVLTGMHMERSRFRSRAIGFREFVVLTAAIMACQAIAVDTMLPALPSIGHDLGVSDANSTQWVITAYIAGVGIGQLFWGLLSDRFGRRRMLLIGLALYVVAATAVGLAGSFEALLAWRFAHGVAAASMVLARSVIRDLYAGRQMARVMSLTFIIFIMVPIIAPSIGQLVLMLAPWRALFHVFSGFAAAVLLWVLIRLPETLHPEYRMTLTAEHIARAVGKVVTDRASVWYTLAVALMFGSIIGYVGMMPQIFGAVFHRPSLMPSAFACCAASMGVAAYLNSRVVERFGMRIISQAGLLVFIAATGLHVLVSALRAETLWTFIVLQGTTMGCLGLIMANFGAMALEAMGAVAGIAASLQGCVGTFGGALVAALMGQQFNGSTLPLALGALLCGLISLGFVLLAERGRLFQPHQLAPRVPGAASPGLH